MQTNYRFSINGYNVNPLFDDGLIKEYSPETGEAFMRAIISGKIKLTNGDFDWLKNQTIQTEFVVLIEMRLSFDSGWSEYWTGKFYKTDCSWDDDNRMVELKFQQKDQYSKVLDAIDKEFNLIKLAPARTLLDIVKRPLIQIYIPGDSVISCFLGGTYWEQDVDAQIDDTNELKKKYYFSLASTVRTFNITGPEEFSEFIGDYSNKGDGLWIEKTGTYKIAAFKHQIEIEIEPGSPGNPGIYIYPYVYFYKIIRISDGVTMFTSDDVLSSITNGKGVPLKNDYTTFRNGTGGTLTGFAFEVEIYMRYLLDAETFLELPTYALPLDDFVSNNRNYKRVINYSFDLITVSLQTQTEPTEYGLADDGKYFFPPANKPGKFYPISRSTWGFSSIWLNFAGINKAFEEKAFKTYTLKDGSLLSDVIKVLLAEIDPDLTHEATTEYSEFLYGEVNPISANVFRLMLTQKSNILAGEYDRPAQKATISLNYIFKMLKNGYKVFWYIEDHKLKFEHISFFKNGRSYTTSPELNVDLTRLIDPRNKLPYGYNTSKYTYNKETLPQSIQFSWMDEVTNGFKGKAIEINSQFVQLGKTDTINIENFTSDIDFMLVNPEAFSQEGFALFAAVYDDDLQHYKLPFITQNIDGAQLTLQNGYASMIYMQPNFWVHDLPSYDVKINGNSAAVKGVFRTKTQTVKYPSQTDPDPLKLVKTYMGSGQINKISINLSSRQNQIELVYDTE